MFNTFFFDSAFDQYCGAILGLSASEKFGK
jgi:hypothetical protein